MLGAVALRDLERRAVEAWPATGRQACAPLHTTHSRGDGPAIFSVFGRSRTRSRSSAGRSGRRPAGSGLWVSGSKKDLRNQPPRLGVVWSGAHAETAAFPPRVAGAALQVAVVNRAGDHRR
jgi:hypothetical protein